MSGPIHNDDEALVIAAPEAFFFLEHSEADRVSFRAEMREYVKKNFALRKPDPAVRRVLKRGWMMPTVFKFEAALWGRWPYWMHLMEGGREAFKEAGPIPHIEFLGFAEPQVKKMLVHCLSEIRQGGDQSWGSSESEYFLEWVLWGLGSGAREPKEPPYCEGASNRLYQLFQAELMLIFPYDYFGDIFAEAKFGRAAGFYPTPMSISIMMAMMTMDRRKDEAEKPADNRLKTVGDEAVGTGRLLLAASNYSLRLYGMDIMRICTLATQVNLGFYAPWGYKPIPFLEDLAREREGNIPQKEEKERS